MQIIESEIIVNAPKNVVWDIIMDKDKYHLWNRFNGKIDNNLEVGKDVILHVNINLDGKIIQQKEQVLWIKEQESIAWGITSGFPVKSERGQILTEINPTQTKYYTYDKFWGILVPLVMFFYRDKIQKGFDSVAIDLKTYAENKSNY